MQRMHSSWGAVLFGVLVGCTTPEVEMERALRPAPDEVPLTQREGWPGAVQVRPVGEAFSGDVLQLEADPKGRIWLLRSEKANGSSSQDAVTTLEVYEADGRRALVLAREEGVLPWRFALHPSGEVTLFEFVKATDARTIRLRLRRLSPEGAVTRERLFEDEGRPEERLYYDLDQREILSISTDTDPRDVWPTPKHARLRAVVLGEEAVFMAMSHGVKLYRLDAELQTRWSSQVMPANYWNGLLHSDQEQLAQDEQGNILVAWSMLASQAQAYRLHFGRALHWSGGLRDIVVLRFGQDGQFQLAQTFGREGDEVELAGLAAHRGEVVLGAMENILKSDRPNDTTEWDLVLMRGRMEDGALSLHRTLDISREDWLHDFRIDAHGHCYFAGTTDFVQADTNSWIEPGKGLLLKTDENGDQLGLLTLTGPRHVEVTHLAFRPDGTIQFGGTSDGPLTHTPLDEWFNETVLGVFSP
ncbi:hypothetical protein [Archangium lansingense]|uniref:Lipoprotein n=1 Tax=Archangium lansingense TaxID=2995310 RepID=A0ABT4AC64_9BACT|nr:hypothetical protein [Archangium lansinium]MCY1079250.1 hypothetical protein [Archangium lansinium]